MPNTLTRTPKLRLTGLILMVLLCFAQVGAQSQVDTTVAAIEVTPQPREDTPHPEKFQLIKNTRISLADSRSADDRFAANDFLDDLKQTTGLELKVGRGGARQNILIGLLSLPAIDAALRSADVTLPPSLNEEGYVLSVSRNGVVIGGATSTGVFYGLQTLKQLVRGNTTQGVYIQGVKITDWPAMRWRGVSDDISRGPVPTVDYIKRQLRTFAMYKLNMHSFYMEHTFSSKAHPLIGPEGGSLTPEEIRELVALHAFPK